MGNIVLNTIVTANVSGTITDCNGNPVTYGDIIVQNGVHYNKYQVDNTGAYNFSTLLCNDPTPVNLIAEDNTALVQSILLTHSLTQGTNVIGNIQACGGGVSTLTWLHFSLDGGATVINVLDTGTGPHRAYETDQPGQNIGIVGSNNYASGIYVVIGFNIDTTGISAGSTQTLQDLAALEMGTANNYLPEDLHALSPTGINVHITEHGGFDVTAGYIAGNFSGMLVGDITGSLHPFVCSFRVQRTW